MARFVLRLGLAALVPAVLLATTSCGGPDDGATVQPAPSRVEPAGSNAVDPARRPRHLILVTVDTLRADHLGAWGYPRGTSDAAHAAERGSAPGFTIDELAAQSIRFPRAFAPVGMTFPSISTLMTGRTPIENCTLENGSLLHAGAPTLAEALSTEGWRCAAFTTNKLLVLGSGIDQGFEHFTSDFSDERDELMAQAAVNWFVENADDGPPLFVWLHLMGPHLPYRPPPLDGVDFAALYADPNYVGPIDGSRPAFDEAHAGDLVLDARDVAQGVALYDGEVARIDHIVSHFASRLAAQQLLDASLFVFGADHGEELDQRHAYWSHSKSVYGSVLHVPLFLRHPASLGPGRVMPSIAGLDDIAQTVLDLVGVRAWDRRTGRSLAARLLGEAPKADPRFAVGMWRDRIFTLRNRRWRLVTNPDGVQPSDPPPGSYPIPEVALYDLHEDPRELVDVARANPTLVERLQRALRQWRDEQPPCSKPLVEPDGERLKALRELGYVGDDPDQPGDGR